MAETINPTERLQEAFGNAIADVSLVQGIPRFRLDKETLPLVAHFVHTHPDLRGSLALLWAVDHRPRETRYELCYLFTLAERKAWLLLCTDLHGDDRLFRSITPHIHAAKWYEREIRDLFGLIAQGHPDLRRLVRHEHWPKGTHPLKKDFPWDTVLERRQGQHVFRRIEGEGVFEVPVGPIHAGIIEPGHFRFSVAGE
nr:NADH-quinone oxidoreductase subunit C [Nitrospirota bacterium]